MSKFGKLKKDNYVVITDEVVISDADSYDKQIELRDGLKKVHVMAYSLGHFCNDLCASMWFVYLTWYIKNIVGLSANVTAGSILSG